MRGIGFNGTPLLQRSSSTLGAHGTCDCVHSCVSLNEGRLPWPLVQQTWRVNDETRTNEYDNISLT